MTSHPGPYRNLRIGAASLGLLFSLALAATSTAALSVAGSNELIMSGYIDNIICGMAFGWLSVPFYIYYLIVAAHSRGAHASSRRYLVIPLVVLAVIGIALSGYQSQVFPAARQCEAVGPRYNSTASSEANCKLPVASGALAWVLVAITLGALVIEIAWNRGSRGGNGQEKPARLTGHSGRRPLNPAV